MSIQSSGPIKLQDIEDEFGGSAPTSLTEYYLNGSYVTSNNTSVPTSGSISLSNFYGASNIVYLTGNYKQITASSYVSSGGILDISSSSYVWSDDVSVAALIIDVACLIINRGKIIGRGGDGGRWGAGGNGGSAISVTASGATLTNSSGAFIAGGGGGGGGSNFDGYQAGGGGGAGGGNGGDATNGGAIGSNGGNGGSIGDYAVGYGGPAGGGGLGGFGNGAGGGGGRIVPGTSSTTAPHSHWTGGTRYTTSTGNSAAGGSGGYANLPGLSAGHNGNIYSGGGGGGGWGAAGGQGKSGGGGSGGAAISGTAVSLTNNGTVYGAT